MYVELHCHTPYSFLDGGSEIEELVRRAAELGMTALAVTDHNSLTAAVKFNLCCKAYSIRPIFGTEITLDDGTHLTLLAKSRLGYANICRLISCAYAHGGRLSPFAPWDAVPLHAQDVVCLTGCRRGKLSSLIRAHRFDDAVLWLKTLKDWYGDDLYVELQDDFTPHSLATCRNLAFLARHVGVKCVSTNNVHYAKPDGMIAHDIKRCIAAGITIADEHETRPLSSERHLKSFREMCSIFDWNPEAVTNTMLVVEKCASDGIVPMDEDMTARYRWLPDGCDSPQFHLRELAYQGARRRRGMFADSHEARSRLDYELNLINTLGYTHFLLNAAHIVRSAREQGVMVTGRGSGADSEVCYCLNLTDIDVIARNLPVARWIAPGKKPDIDLDFDARRRDDVFRWIAKEYGQDTVALCCTYMCYQAKGAVRDIGKVLAIPDEAVEWFRKHISGFVSAAHIREAFAKYAELRDHAEYAERFEQLFDLCARIADHPRHLGSHSSGLVISEQPLAYLNAVTPSARGVLPIVMLDKDDVESAGAIKLDILSLPILSVVKDASYSIGNIVPGFTHEQIPLEDNEVYKMLWSGDNMGLFQLGSPAQANLATQLHPRDFEDLVASIGLIRPGPIRSNAVRKYVNARNGYSRIEVLHPCLEPIVRRTYGVVCFQEQVVLVIAAMMGISEAEADVWRKALTKHSKRGTMDIAREEFLSKSLALHRDLSPASANVIMDELSGWVGLGFVEGHSASFALTAQKTAWMLRYHPSRYYSALLSNQPCGFYEAQQIAAEARRRGAVIRRLDINQSRLECYVVDKQSDDIEADTIQLGFCLMSGIRELDVDAILAERDANGPYRSLLDFCARTTINRDALENLVLCGAFDRLHDSRRRGLIWRLDETIAKASAIRYDLANRATMLDIRHYGETDTPLAWNVPELSDWDAMMWEWRVIGVTSTCHPFAFVREQLAREGIMSAHEVKQQPHGKIVRVAGLNIRPHRPPSKSGGRHLFSTLEDETAYLQLAFYNDAIDRCTSTILLSPVVVVEGMVKRKGLGAQIEVRTAQPLSMMRLIHTNVAEEIFTAAPQRSSSAR